MTDSPKAADVPSASTDEVRAWDTALARKPAVGGLREALERMAGHDPRDPALSYDTLELLVQSAAQAAKDALADLAAPAPAGREAIAACLQRVSERRQRFAMKREDALVMADAILALGVAVSPQDGGAGLDREEIERLRSCLQGIEMHELRDHEDYEHIKDLAGKFLRDSISRDRGHTPPAPVADRAAVIEAIFDKMQPLIGQLTNFQTQLDQDGICVGISRQALNELFEFIEELRSLAPKGAA